MIVKLLVEWNINFLNLTKAFKSSFCVQHEAHSFLDFNAKLKLLTTLFMFCVFAYFTPNNKSKKFLWKARKRKETKIKSKLSNKIEIFLVFTNKEIFFFKYNWVIYLNIWGIEIIKTVKCWNNERKKWERNYK